MTVLRAGRSGRKSFIDLEAPFPQAHLNLTKREFDAAMPHDFGGTSAPFVSSAANSLKIVAR
jgi:hypothetical protein